MHQIRVLVLWAGLEGFVTLPCARTTAESMDTVLSLITVNAILHGSLVTLLPSATCSTLGCTIPTASKATTRSVQSVIGNTSSTQRQTCAVNAAKSTMSTASNVITCSVWSANGRTLFTQTGCRTIDQSQARPGAILKPRPCSQTTRYQTNTWRSTTLSETSLTLSSKNRRSRTKKHRQLKAMRKN